MMKSFFKRIHPFSSGQRFHCDFAPGISPDLWTEQPVRVRPISQWCVSVCAMLFLTLLRLSCSGDAHARRVLQKSAVPSVSETPLGSILSYFDEF